MEAKAWGRVVSAAKGVEARLDAWAARRLPADEYAEAAALDRHLREHFLRWLGLFVLVVATGAGLAMAIWPALPVRDAFVDSTIVCLYLLFAIASPWYGYRKWTRRPAWLTFLVLTALMLAGAVIGYAIVNVKMGKGLVEIEPERVMKAVAIAMLFGLALAALLIGISRLRLREAAQRAARLAAEAERERLARHSMQAELKLLQAQVEPHFLFNTLANLRHLVQTGSPQAVTMLDYLIQYLRTALPEIRAETSTLGREAALVQAYLEILRIRMGGALDIAVEIPADLTHQPIPPLMLITLVENAVKHGIAPVGRGSVRVSASRQGNRVRVAVEDDGRGLQAPIGRGVGLANIRERLHALYGDAAHLDLAGRDPAGTCACIELPA